MTTCVWTTTFWITTMFILRNARFGRSFYNQNDSWKIKSVHIDWAGICQLAGIQLTSIPSSCPLACNSMTTFLKSRLPKSSSLIRSGSVSNLSMFAVILLPVKLQKWTAKLRIFSPSFARMFPSAFFRRMSIAYLPSIKPEWF